MAPKRCSSRAVDIVCFEKTSKNYSGINDPCKALLTDEALAKKLFGQLAVGAQWLAKCGVVHKDLKTGQCDAHKALPGRRMELDCILRPWRMRIEQV